MVDLDNNTNIGGIITVFHQGIPTDLCEKAFNVMKSKVFQGYTRNGVCGGGHVPETKNSYDFNPLDESCPNDPLTILAKAIQPYINDCIYRFCKDNPAYGYSILKDFSLCDINTLPDLESIYPRQQRIQNPQYQYYPLRKDELSGGYPANHSETNTFDQNPHTGKRTLVYMATLNNLPVTKEQYGYTCFVNQKLAVRPIAGQVVIFDPTIAAMHRGNCVKDVDKAIVTSWCSTF
jgi:hypothetical protein